MRSFQKGVKRKAPWQHWLGLGLLLVGLNASAATATSTPVNDTPVKAVWQVKEIYFPYFGLTTHYSCDGLRDKVRLVLSKLGARDDMMVSVGGCTELNGPVRNPSVRIIVANPVDASNAEAVKADPKRAKLLSQLSRKGKTPHSDEPFDATLQRVTLLSKDPQGISAAGDCELLEQMRDRVIKPMGGNIVKDEVRCTPYQGSVGNQRMEVEILIAAR